jgi:hypothetical protein
VFFQTGKATESVIPCQNFILCCRVAALDPIRLTRPSQSDSAGTFCETEYPDVDSDPYYPANWGTVRRKFGIEILCSWLADIVRELTGTVPPRTLKVDK